MKVFALAALCLAGCATSYNGGKMGLDGGVEAQMTTNDCARISARGNSATDPSRMTDFTLLKATETAQEQGFTHFALIQSIDASSSGVTTTFSTKKTAYGTIHHVRRSHPYFRPGQDTLVQFCKGSCPGMFSAKEVIANLGLRYYAES